MSDRDRELWDQKAADWDTQVGEGGDSNRRFNSDPFLWAFVGSVRGKTVLDAGCGTGYLARLLHRMGAQVWAVDFSEEMVKVAQSKEFGESIHYFADSCSELTHIGSESIQLIVSNYVLMDLPDLEGAAQSFYRVLEAGGDLVFVITHPCFPLSDFSSIREDGSVHFKWNFSYFDRQELKDPPWRHFTTPFTWYHRPLRDYIQVFKTQGFELVDLDEPVVQDPPPEGFPVEKLTRYRMRPNSVILKFHKPA
jgi:ubiquinone/menaquinone biosynthesis C-methylase UbiE